MPSNHEITNLISTQSWPISLDGDKYESLLTKSVAKLLNVFHQYVTGLQLDAIAPLIWNDQADTWHFPPFSTTDYAKDRILEYFWLRDQLKVPGPTNLMFLHVKSPCFVLTFRLKTEKAGSDNRYVFRKVSANSLDFFCFDLPATDATRHLERNPFDVESVVTKTQGTKNNNRIVSIVDLNSKPSKWKTDTIDEWKKSFDEIISTDMERPEWLLLQSEIVERLGEYKQNHQWISDFDPREMCKSLALITLSLQKLGPGYEFAYFFNSSNVRLVDGSVLVTPRSDGGSFAVLTKYQGFSDEILLEKYSELYSLLATTLTKIAAVQKIFRRHSEERQAHRASIASMRAAIAGVMGRNMSHNQGSHALGYIADDLLEKPEKYKYSELSGFMRYLQKRMDFIAQISTSAPSWCLSQRWSAFNDGFVQQHCLLDNIARSDRIVHPRIDAKEACARPDGFGRLVIQVDSRCEVDHLTSPLVDVPHGQIGAQAFYSIMENLIRNAAKYGAKLREDGQPAHSATERFLNINIEIAEAEEIWQDNFYRVAISDGPKRIATVDIQLVVDRLNRYLEDAIIDVETAELKPGHWGMKEIKICASYLRLIAQEDIDQHFNKLKNGTQNQPPVVQVQAVDGRIEYVLYLLRPKTALVVDSVFSDQKTANQGFKRAGIEFLTWPMLERRVGNGVPLRHQFLVLNAASIDSIWLCQNKDLLPCRILMFGVTAEAELPVALPDAIRQTVKFSPTPPVFEDPHAFKLWAWSQWTSLPYGQLGGRPCDRELYVRWDKEGSPSGLFHFVHQARFFEARDNAIVYDHCSDADCRVTNNADNPKYSLYQAAAFHEILDAGSPARSLFEHIEANEALSPETTEAILRLKDASSVTVAILDERILEKQEQPRSGIGTSKYSDSLTFKDAWEKRGVYLLDHELAQVDFTKFLTSVGLGLRRDNRENNRYDFLIVHQGILDKIRHRQPQVFQRQQSNIDGVESEWERLKALARHVVITTGRGKAPTAQEENLRWVEYSNLSDAVFRGCKLDLTSLLFAVQAELRKKG